MRQAETDLLKQSLVHKSLVVLGLNMFGVQNTTNPVRPSQRQQTAYIAEATVSTTCAVGSSLQYLFHQAEPGQADAII